MWDEREKLGGRAQECVLASLFRSKLNFIFSSHSVCEHRPCGRTYLCSPMGVSDGIRDATP